ncbi:MAG TPA: RnfH family protein [Casimicrobiaceae bacterium]|nr:RnfH family protein [Casimicrobiaceae bacterium]
MRVHVAYVAPGLELCIAVDVDDGATVDDVVRTSRIADRIGPTADSHGFAIFGQRVSGDALVAPDDRIEITRPLICDAKTARRTRAAVASRKPAAGSHSDETAPLSSDRLSSTARKAHDED